MIIIAAKCTIMQSAKFDDKFFDYTHQRRNAKIQGFFGKTT